MRSHATLTNSIPVLPRLSPERVSNVHAKASPGARHSNAGLYHGRQSVGFQDLFVSVWGDGGACQFRYVAMAWFM